MIVYGLVVRVTREGATVEVKHTENDVEVYYETREQADEEQTYWQTRSYHAPRYGELEIYRVAQYDIVTL